MRGRVAFLSTPSVYFAVKSKGGSEKELDCILFDVRSFALLRLQYLSACWSLSLRFTHVLLLIACLQFDVKFATEGTNKFVPFDFNTPEQIPLELHSSFDFVVIDPPFITKEVWEKYADTAKLLMRGEGCKILLTTIGEREYDAAFAWMPAADIQALDPAPRVPVCALHELPLASTQRTQSGA
ncbi:hypothetical protein PybrP1_009701 [[Pythium] brassicae (nom. inval.)]|nr:hypothetical protein PybrP1_009701 [[Pythium] brassicae (nom. inval.)]